MAKRSQVLLLPFIVRKLTAPNVQKLTDNVAYRSYRFPKWITGESSQFSRNHPFYHMVINNSVLVRGTVDQTMCCRFIYHANGAA